MTSNGHSVNIQWDTVETQWTLNDEGEHHVTNTIRTQLGYKGEAAIIITSLPYFMEILYNVLATALKSGKAGNPYTFSQVMIKKKKGYIHKRVKRVVTRHSYQFIARFIGLRDNR